MDGLKTSTPIILFKHMVKKHIEIFHQDLNEFDEHFRFTNESCRENVSFLDLTVKFIDNKLKSV